jgi:tetratricopeptide (TPR) repeat protein
MKKAVELAKNKAPFYNMLGYSYLGANKMKEAEETFNKYIELEPNEANPYDSKGDYFMAMKDYQNAYDSFMKAYQLNNSFTASKKKAEKAKQILEEKKNE